MIGLLISAPAFSFAGPADEAGAAIDRWTATFNSNDADAVVKLYTPDAILLGTVSPAISEGSGHLREYFKALPGSGNKVEIGERRLIVVGPEAVLATGFYQFNPIRDGKPVAAPARSTLLLVKRGSEWLIAHHHSSRRPEPPK
jgi:uncharacterized protein (TIGR02246 family)